MSNTSAPNVSRTELEISIMWASENPELFLQTYNKFFEDYPSDTWNITSHARKGFLTLDAERIS